MRVTNRGGHRGTASTERQGEGDAA